VHPLRASRTTAPSSAQHTYRLCEWSVECVRKYSEEREKLEEITFSAEVGKWRENEEGIGGGGEV
jgi:hypothetical protein